MNKNLFVSTLLLSTLAVAQIPWFVSNPLTVNCERLQKKGHVTMVVEIRGKSVTIKDLLKNEEQTYVTRVTQSNRLKHWDSPQISLSIALKPSRWSEVFGGKEYHSGALEFNGRNEQERYASLYCFPQASAE